MLGGEWTDGTMTDLAQSAPSCDFGQVGERFGTWHSVLTMEIIEEDSSLHHREWVDGSEYSGRGFDRTMEPELCRYRSEEHTSELQSLMRISYAVFCLKKTIEII